MKSVLVGGCFDILHLGHVKFLKKAKSFGDYLIVLLEPDANIKKLKGSTRPLQNERQRKEILFSLNFVDKVILVPNNATGETYNKIVKKLKPSVIATTQGDPIKHIKLLQAKSVGAKLKVIKMYKSLSTTKITQLLEIE